MDNNRERERFEAQGPYHYKGDLHPSFNIRSSTGRIVGCIYITDEDMDRAEAEADACVLALDAMHGQARAALDTGERVSSGYTLPDGWKIVPIKPTVAMVDAAYDAHNAYESAAAAKAWCGLHSAYIAMLSAVPQPPAPPISDDAEPLIFTYRNWRGETAQRRAIPQHVYFGATEWHPEPQWLMRAFDVDKGEVRDFAMRDMERACCEGGSDCTCHEQDASTSAGRGGAGAVSVKPLEWVDESDEDGSVFEARSIIHIYEVRGHHLEVDGHFARAFESTEAAKAAAQANYERRVMSCITTEPAHPSAFERGVEAWRDVIAERTRQIAQEGWSSEHDDDHADGEIALAAAAYAENTASGYDDAGTPLDDAPPITWPWAEKWWKPSNRRRDLVKAAALLLAEIERLDRALPLPKKEGRACQN